MKKLLLIALLAAFSLGCAITDYPVIFDTRGADADGVMTGQYDLAYIVTSQVATIWDDGSDELFTLVSQDWKGDQWLKTYNNYDPSGIINFLDQTYCDPTFDSSFCAIATAWNPDLPNAYPHGDQGAGYNNVDDVFDYVLDLNCNGARSLSLLVSYTSRYGECGSSVWADRQGAAYEFSLLEKVNFRGQSVYHIPVDSTVATFTVNGADLPIYGRFNMYMNDKLQVAFPVTPNARYQLNAIDRVIQRDGHFLDVNMTYGSLNANFKVNVTTVQNALDRL
ncbi:MAG: hypothetical protein MUF27_12720 [Acidobacteria bacterium]|jgi:hypothetical protein|nr:hypothetical protein [Acidobacteriota bacterium]